MKLWRKRDAESKTQAENAQSEYEQVVQNRTIVADVLARLNYHGEKNGIVEMLHLVAKGHP